MTLRTTGLLSVLALLLGVLLWFDRSLPQTPAMREPGSLLPFSMDEVILAGLQAGTGGFECARTADAWRLTRPIEARADPAALDRLLVSLEQLPLLERLRPEDLQARGLSLADYGLQPPAAVITLGTERDKRLLDVGRRSPLGDSVYARWRDRPGILTTSTNLLTLLRTDAASIRDRRLIRGDVSDVVRLELKAAGRPVVQLAREGRSWMMQKPTLARADSRRVHILLSQILRLEAQTFVSETLADPMTYGVSGDEAVLQVGLWLGRSGQSERLVFGKPLADRPELLYACGRNGNAIVAVDRQDVELLAIRPEDVRDRRLPLPPLDQVRAVRLQRGETALSLVKGPAGQWWLLDPARGPADEERVASMFRYLANLRVQAFLPAAGSQAPAVDMARPAGQLCLSTAKGVSESALQALARADTQPVPGLFCLRWQAWGSSNRYVAVCGQADEFLELPPGVEEVLQIEPLWFRDRTVLALDPAAVRRLSLRTAAGVQTVERNDRGGWWAAPVSPGLVDGDLARDILAWAATLRALRLAQEPASDGNTNEWRTPRLSLTFGLSGEGGIQKTLHLGDDAPDGSIRARVQGQDAVFFLDRAMPLRLLQGGLVRSEPE